MKAQNIRNFVIISHIDHGKSTLADRMIESTNTVDKRGMREQILDGLDLERERGITIKLTPVRMEHQGYILNLIDTPGHVDFAYEVSRSMQAVEGAVLLVDATQGIQAQTIANLMVALEHNVTVIPVVNKIDLPAADVPGATAQIAQLLGVDKKEVLAISAKTGAGVDAVLDAVVKRTPCPTGKTSAPLRALVFDSLFDQYQGVIAYIRVVEGAVQEGDEILLAGEDIHAAAQNVGVFRPSPTVSEKLSAGEIGFITTGLRDVAHARVGDTVIAVEDAAKRSTLALPGYTVPQPKVFAGMYPESGDDFHLLRDALAKYRLNDASFQYQQESTPALGQGFRCGFLGLLHLSIVRERVEREYNVSILVTAPSVAYRVASKKGEHIRVTTPAQFPDPSLVERAEEQWVRVEIVGRSSDIGSIMELLISREGIHRNTEYLSPKRILVSGEMPLREMVSEFHDALKGATSGYASVSYELSDWRETRLAKLSIIVGGEIVEPLTVIVPAQRAQSEGRRIVERLKGAIPRHLFPVPLQAALGGKIIARETIPALRKDVTGHLYGGDVTRKRKLLEKQKKGKKRMANQGGVHIPPDAFLAAMKRSSD